MPARLCLAGMMDSTVDLLGSFSISGENNENPLTLGNLLVFYLYTSTSLRQMEAVLPGPKRGAQFLPKMRPPKQRLSPDLNLASVCFVWT